MNKHVKALNEARLKVNEIVKETPLMYSYFFSEEYEANVYLKVVGKKRVNKGKADWGQSLKLLKLLAKDIYPEILDKYEKKEITEKLNLQGTISLGLSFIDTRTERLTKGFTFIENFSLGFSYKIVKNSYLYIGTNFGHVSNLNFQKPNDGYNVLGIEIGYSYVLE